MKRQQILVIDDERDLCEILQFNLTSVGYIVDVAYSGEEALRKDLTRYDLLLLDVMMPGISGFELAKRVKGNPATSATPIIFLTALGSESDLLHGFELGADDYISKPFSIREVKARVKAVLGRTSDDADAPTILRYDGLRLDLAKMTVTVDGEPVSLTRTEFDLLRLLLSLLLRLLLGCPAGSFLRRLAGGLLGGTALSLQLGDLLVDLLLQILLGLL